MTDIIQTEMLKEQMKSKHETSHILHLILTILTFGFWAFVWGLCALRNMRLRSEIDERFSDLQIKALSK
jgi:Na+-transporting NADH:ubiquinone oxidoreductase subunit NqrC